MVDTAQNIWRDWVTDGIPASTEHEPDKVEIRRWGTYVETGILGASAGGVIFGSRANLEADLDHAGNTMAWVIADATAANNGIYRKLGGSGTGSWTRDGDLPYGFIRATNAGAGTANAIIATTSIPVPSADGGALIALPIVATNTASPVTVALNGGSALTIKTVSGNDIAVAGLVSGMVVAGYVAGSGTELRLLTDQDVAGTVAQVEAVLAEFQTIYLGAFATADAPTTDLEGNPLIAGAQYFDTDDNERKTWNGSEWISALLPDESVTRPKLAPYIDKNIAPTPEDYEAVGDGIADDTEFVQNAINAGKQLDFQKWLPRSYRLTAPIVVDHRRDYIINAMNGLNGGWNVKFLIDHTDGPGVWFKKSTFICSGLHVVASDTRNAAAYGGGNLGILIGGDESQATTLGHIERCLVERQPDEGVGLVGVVTGTTAKNVRSRYNRGHAWIIDDGMKFGYSAVESRPGIITLDHCRGEECGGNGLNAAGSTSVYRLIVEQGEFYWNAWNSNISGLLNFDVDILAQNPTIDTSAYGDGGYADTVMTNGDAREAKASKAWGVNIRSNSAHIHMRNSRSSDGGGYVEAGDNIEGIHIDEFQGDHNIPLGYKIGANNKGVWIRQPKVDQLGTILSSQSQNGKLIVADQEWVIRGNTGAPSNLHWRPDQTDDTPITSGTVHIRTGVATLIGESDTTDSLVNIDFNGPTAGHRNGDVIRLINRNAYNIFVQHASGNIHTKTGAAVTLGTDQGMSVVCVDGEYYEV